MPKTARESAGLIHSGSSLAMEHGATGADVVADARVMDVFVFTRQPYGRMDAIIKDSPCTNSRRDLVETLGEQAQERALNLGENLMV